MATLTFCLTFGIHAVNVLIGWSVDAIIRAVLFYANVRSPPVRPVAAAATINSPRGVKATTDASCMSSGWAQIQAEVRAA